MHWLIIKSCNYKSDNCTNNDSNPRTKLHFNQPLISYFRIFILLISKFTTVKLTVHNISFPIFYWQNDTFIQLLHTIFYTLKCHCYTIFYIFIIFYSETYTDAYIYFEEVWAIAVIAANDAQIQLLARLMRAEAEVMGISGCLVCNVGVNRVRADWLDYENIRSIEN